MPAAHDDPATVAAVEEFLVALSDIPAVAMDQDTAEMVLADVVDTLADRARDAEWGWVACFCTRGGLADTFSIFQHAGGSADERHGLLVRGTLAFEAAQIALGHTSVAEIVARDPGIVRLFVLQFERMPQALVCAALRTPVSYTHLTLPTKA